MRNLEQLHAALVECHRCPRLVAWRERVAVEKRRAFRDQVYWGRPVPGFGDPAAPLVIVGLAPGAHGANRTGRMFTGDRSGDFLYAALHRARLSSQAESRCRDDRMSLQGVYITAPCRCAPPENKPSADELASCRPWLDEELMLLSRARVYLALGKTGYDAVLGLAKQRSSERITAPAFGHGVRAMVPDPRGSSGDVQVFASYHVSQQNTQTGRLTVEMFDAVLGDARRAAGI